MDTFHKQQKKVQQQALYGRKPNFNFNIPERRQFEALSMARMDQDSNEMAQMMVDMMTWVQCRAVQTEEVMAHVHWIGRAAALFHQCAPAFAQWSNHRRNVHAARQPSSQEIQYRRDDNILCAMACIWLQAKYLEDDSWHRNASNFCAAMYIQQDIGAASLANNSSTKRLKQLLLPAIAARGLTRAEQSAMFSPTRTRLFEAERFVLQHMNFDMNAERVRSWDMTLPWITLLPRLAAFVNWRHCIIVHLHKWHMAFRLPGQVARLLALFAGNDPVPQLLSTQLNGANPSDFSSARKIPCRKALSPWPSVTSAKTKRQQKHKQKRKRLDEEHIEPAYKAQRRDINTERHRMSKDVVSVGEPWWTATATLPNTCTTALLPTPMQATSPLFSPTPFLACL